MLFPLALALKKNAAALVPGQKEGGEPWKGNKSQRSVSPAERAIVFLHLHCRA